MLHHLRRTYSEWLIRKALPHFSRKRLLLEALKGTDVECPCCKGQFLTFMPFGHKARRAGHALCPQCGTLPRHRLMWMYLMEHTRLLKDPMRVLHIAPERFFFKLLKDHPKVDYLAGDKFAPGYAYPEGTIDLDVTSLALPDDSFDVVICSHVLEHVPDDVQGMREILRVLKPGGFAIIQVPLDRSMAVTDEDITITDPEERQRRFGQHDHFRLYGLDLRDRLAQAGFEVHVEPYSDKFDMGERFRYGLPKDEDIHFCVKPRRA